MKFQNYDLGLWEIVILLTHEIEQDLIIYLTRFYIYIDAYDSILKLKQWLNCIYMNNRYLTLLNSKY